MRGLFIAPIAAILLAAASSAIATAAHPQTTGSTMPSDIDPKSGFRLPRPNREDLDEAGKKAYDRGTTPGATIAGLQGPSGIALYSPKTAGPHTAINRYMRFEAAVPAHAR